LDHRPSAFGVDTRPSVGHQGALYLVCGYIVFNLLSLTHNSVIFIIELLKHHSNWNKW